jgi:hypothetical protein
MPLHAIQWYCASLDRKSVDVVLRSADAIHPRARKVILTDTSTVLEDVFANARSSASASASLTAGDKEVDGLPLVSHGLTEGGSVLGCLLLLYYAPYASIFKPPIADLCGAHVSA